MEPRNTQIITSRSKAGEEFLIEVSVIEDGQSNKRDKVADFETTYENLAGSIRSVSALLVDTLKEISPDKCSVEFGLEMSLRAGKLLALLCSGEGKANLKITLEWEKKQLPIPEMKAIQEVPQSDDNE